jgi:cytochrome P450
MVSQLDNTQVNASTMVSNLLSDDLALKQFDKPIVMNVSSNSGTILHDIRDPQLYRYVGQFHRYGKSFSEAAENERPCPFTAGVWRKKFTKLFDKPNLLTLFEEEHSIVKRAMQRFLNANAHLLCLQTTWERIARKWIEAMVQQGEVQLFAAVKQLVASYLIEGILGYPCDSEELTLNAEFWCNLTWPLPSGMRTLEELNSDVQASVWESFTSKLLDGLEVIKKAKLVLYEKRSIDKLVKNILAHSRSEQAEQQSFCNFLREELQNEELVEGAVALMLVAGQETVGNFLSFLLYEYGKNTEMQDEHAKILEENIQGQSSEVSYLKLAKATPCYSMYLEALRIYATGGTIREAACDMILSWQEETGDPHHHYIRTGESVMCWPALLGYNPHLWDDPLHFDSSRPDVKDVKKKVMPFGTGKHQCPGEKAAEHQIMTTLATLLLTTKIESLEPLPDLLSASVIRPIHDITVRFTRR